MTAALKTTLYKLTDQAGYTRPGLYNACLWGPGVSHSGTGEGELCGPGWVHAYTHPLLAVLLNPIHAAIDNPRLWEAEGDVVLSDNGLKVGCRTLTTLREMPVPVVTTEQRVRFAILCALTVNRSELWERWAERWLSGEDRSKTAAWATWAEAAAQAAEAEEAAARAATWAAEAAEAAAAAAHAARTAAETVAGRRGAAPLDLVALAEQAVREEV